MEHLLTGIRNVIFDFGGVLIDIDKEACVSEFDRLGIPQIRAIANNYRQTGILLRLEKGEITPQEFRDELRAISGSSASDEEIDNAWGRFVLTVPAPKIELLLNLKRAGYKVCLLSNTNEIHAPKFLKQYFNSDGLSANEYFDKYYLSCRLGMAKPDKEIFEYVLQDGEMIPEQTLLLDDGPMNITAAAALGMRTYQPELFEDFTPLFRL